MLYFAARQSIRRATNLPEKASATKSSFWNCTIGERMVVYLAISDACMCTMHILDHAWIYHVLDFPPDIICKMFSFILQVPVFINSNLITFTHSLNYLLFRTFASSLAHSLTHWCRNTTGLDHFFLSFLLLYYLLT